MPTTGHSLAAELQRATGAATSADAMTLEEVSRDFGGLTRKRPRVAVRPAGAEQVAAVLRFAAVRGITVSTRGAGHSLSGQSLSRDGILMDLRGMDTVGPVDEEGEWVEAQPGAVWRALVDATLEHGLVPPVLTGTLSTSVGGTHSVGGLGSASFRHGIQADHCLALEVATVDGAVRWCSAEREPELFQHVLCGLGQLGVVTRVRHRLRRFRPHTRTHALYYPNRRRMLADLDRIVREREIDFVSGYGWPVSGRFAYMIEATIETEYPGRDGREASLEALGADVRRDVIERRFSEFLLRTVSPDDRESRERRCGHVNPWVDALLPGSEVDACFRETLLALPVSVLRRSTLLFWPVARPRRPLFMVPDAESVMLAGIFPTVPEGELRVATRAMTSVGERLAALGGKRYLYGWIDLDEKAWEEHFGSRWPVLKALKERYDPDHLLNPGIILYGAPAELGPPALAEAS